MKRSRLKDVPHFLRNVLFVAAALVAIIPVRAFAQCGPLDVVFVVDTTGSMSGAIANVKAALPDIISQIETASGGDYRLGLLEFRDDIIVLNDIAAGNTESVRSNILGLSASGGEGGPEASDEALKTVIQGLRASDRPAGLQTGDFGTLRAGAEKIVILITDDLPGGFDDTFTPGEDDVNANNLALEAKSRSILISAVHIPTNPDTRIESIMRNYADVSGGIYVKTAADGNGTADAITNIISDCGGSQFPASERDALIALYNSTNGGGWTNRQNWLGAPGTECTWFGVTCNAEGTTVTDLIFSDNRLTGTIPSQIGNFPNLKDLSFWNNRLSGSIPSQLGNLSALRRLSLRSNQLGGSLPSSLASLNLDFLDLHYNALSASGSVLSWANSRNPGWTDTQTVAPTNLNATASGTSITLTWTPIAYTGDSGRYEIYRAIGTGSFVLGDTTSNKSASSVTLTGLPVSTNVRFYIQTVTLPHGSNQNEVRSAQSETVSATTVSVPRPGVTFDATPEAILEGQASTLTWATSNADSVSIDRGLGARPLSGSVNVSPAVTTTYTLTATGAGGTTTAQVTVRVGAPPPSVNFTANPLSILPGESSTLSWTTTRATSVTIDNGVGVQPLSGSVIVRPTVTTTYTLTARGPDDTVTRQVTVVVNAAPPPPPPQVVIETFKATPALINPGELATLEWVFAGHTTGRIDQCPTGGSCSNLIPAINPRGSRVVSPSVTTTYKLVVNPCGAPGCSQEATAVAVIQVGASTESTVTTAAGSPGNPGANDGSGQVARFNRPRAAAIDPSTGDTIVVDGLNHTVRRITPSGFVSTIAGVPGVPGMSDGPGSSARFDFRNGGGGVAVDNDGVIFIGDSGNHVIRKITPSGMVSVFAGTPGQAGMQDGTEESGRFNFPTNLAVDGQGDLIVADTENHTIRKISKISKGTTTIIGQPGQSGNTGGPARGTARLNRPRGVGVDGSGNIYFTDLGNNNVRFLDLGGMVNTIAGPGAGNGTPAFNFGATGGAIAVTPGGTIYVTDSGMHTVSKLSKIQPVPKPIAGQPGVPGTSDGAGDGSRLNNPTGVAVDPNGALLVTDTGNHVVRFIVPPASCISDDQSACLLNGRFKATVSFRNSFDNGVPDSQALRRTLAGFGSENFETMFFYFNDPNNIEILLKMLDQGNVDASGRPTIAVLFGTATPLRVEVTIVDTVTGEGRTYTSEFGRMQGATDFTAFVK